MAITPMLEERVGAMLAAGITKTDIAESLDINRATVERIRQRPTAQATIQAVRETMRRKSVEQAERVTEDAFLFLRETIKSRDAKAFDAVSRGIASIERAASSASGEARKVEQTTREETPAVVEEAKQLLAAFLQGGVN